MLVSPDSIIVKKRIRRDLGDIEGLMESLKVHGQLAPIIINRNYELIAGFRRLQAVKRLGWKTIEAVIVDRETDQQKLEIEMEENIQRRDLSAEEIAEGMARLQKLRNPGLLARIWSFILRIFRSLFPRKRRRR
ncbi:MAG: ParB/RepB/Spo0J family partition protein [Spirochaetales bacterium]|nr:ParB/RepB/Spo0J family partition protein [Spirochaetales bacterium]